MSHANQKRWRPSLVAAMFLLLAGLFACGGAQTVETSAEPVANETTVIAKKQVATEVPTSIPPTASEAPVEAVTEEPTASPPTPEEQLSALDEWDLVWISDSTGWGAADIYGQFIAEDMGVNVIVHDFAKPVLSAGEVLGGLRRERLASYKVARLADAVAEAEIVVFYANPIHSMSDEYPDDSNCMLGNLYVNSCPPVAFDLYRQHLGEIYDQILELRGDQPMIIHAYDSYQFPRRWAEDDVLEECQACWGVYTQAIHDAAAAHGIPIAHVYDAFTGPDHEIDPRDTGLIGGDGQHTTEAGAELIASLVRDLGYEVTSP